ncbi:hypothetical protein [Desmospora profundinema]|uniref:Uncharacterized protein n=1 Tax=Desmospora profundinema TaxID=1571184 RepID=A0ABU1INM7_9BACL|nr:hypothetical protein [Desmospora profundinema]MDR6226311.1 hypothetical protein [Desmospora profundinema]
MNREKREESTREQVERMMDEGLGAGITGSISGKVDHEEVIHKQEMAEQNRQEAQQKDVDAEGRHRFTMDVDRMVNEGLGSGRLEEGTGLIEESHVDADAKDEK